MKIFGGTFGAYRLVNNSYKHGWKVVTVVCPTNNDAYLHFYSMAEEFYPSQDGWYGHYAGTVEVSESQIEEYLTANNF